MKKIILIFNKQNKKEYLKAIKNENLRSNLILIESANKNKIFEKIHLADALIGCPREYFTKELFQNTKKLKWIHAGGAGIDQILIPEIKNSNIVFTHGKIIQGPEVADHALGLLLSITRNLHLHIKGEAPKNIQRPIELRNKTCGIFGMGGIGFSIAERLKGFGAKVIGISEDLIPLVSFVDEFYTTEKLLKILPRLDVLICAAPLTKDTFKLFNLKHFKKMKKGSIFINISRGKLVDIRALLKNNIYLKFRGIGLDVTDPEPLLKGHALNNLKNIIITPHTAGLSDKNRARSVKLIIKNIKRFLKNKHLLNIADKDRGY